ncbi:GNAT family N-acetyltransferase [Parvibaculum sp.]|uniref:GNAT family N-acetyltransferase n=1 Tax=Parvibaculum sp. TaxID=2024848 RepID=UPI00272F6562|nr:GNAT family N-acetyltransferase [Parvibaculum sp.]MDP1625808.1 GNAT family N-acetyltransferase [Parvibaculum sp.]MDP2149171.1 GNAT family N-acetyltransferase [Parvibaculum sp.]MDP3326754.1 GNAT family N-acetyltransferase [Parvibaculum sp.]
MTTIDVTPARPDEKPVLANLMQLYIHDFSEHWAGMANGELQNDGRFPAYPHLDAYWSDPARIPLLLRREGVLIGFALLNDHAHGGVAVDRNMAEFFIVRKHRRGGMGTAAAHAVFSRYPGSWEAAVARRNLAALAFWRKAIASHPHVRDIEEIDISTKEWNGPVIRFRILPLA